MTIDEMMMFNGGAKELEEYQKLLKKRDRLRASVRNLSDKILDEEDSISVFDGDLSEEDEKLFREHVSARKKYLGERALKQGQLDLVMLKIAEYQGRKEK
jgi:hypothetical protein